MGRPPSVRSRPIGWALPRPQEILLSTVDSTLDLLTFALLPDVGPRKVLELRARAPLAALALRPLDAGDLLKPHALQQLQGGLARTRAESEIARARTLGLRLVGLDDEDYPPLLRQAFDPPSVLYVRGDLAGCGPERPCVAIVGARGASAAGLALARSLARDLARVGVTIVSGLARGIDTAAHRGALDAGGTTIAVQGRGMDGIYPPENAGLAQAIVNQAGAILAECPLGAGPVAENFPRRNRIIAGLCRGTVVVEAAKRSGALITARFAMEEGRDVMAVPGHPSDERSFGPNALLRDGAVLVRDAGDIAAEIGLTVPAPLSLAAPSDPILAALASGAPASLEDLALRTGWAIADLLSRLGELEMEARVRRLPGPLFLRT